MKQGAGPRFLLGIESELSVRVCVCVWGVKTESEMQLYRLLELSMNSQDHRGITVRISNNL